MNDTSIPVTNIPTAKEFIIQNKERFQGLSDSPLTEKGVEQAKLLGKKLKNIDFNKF